MGQRSRRPRRGRNPIDIHGPRRHRRGIRLRPDPSDCASCPHSGNCVGRSGRSRTLCPGFPRRRSGRGAGCIYLSLWPELDLRVEKTLTGGRNSREAAVLIPSIDLMGGKIVQLVQGDKKALEVDNFDDWVTRFSSFPLVQLIDLYAAMAREANASLIEFFVKRLPCPVAGGIRSFERARHML